MASSSSLQSALSLPPTMNWAELPSELTSSIMLRLSVIERLESAQRVCTRWRRACQDPLMWRKIDMRNLRRYDYNLDAMCRLAVDLSQGGLLEIKIGDFGNGDLVRYIADRSSNLRSLELADCYFITSFGISKAVVKLPLLEELNLSFYSIEGHHLKGIGQACPNLKTLKLNYMGSRPPPFECDDDALAIAETMPGLRHLEIFGNELSDTGVDAILENCPHLEHLDLRRCVYVNLVGDMEKRCVERIKVVRRPDDSTADYPYYFISSDSDSEDYAYDDYAYGSDDYDSCKRSI